MVRRYISCLLRLIVVISAAIGVLSSVGAFSDSFMGGRYSIRFFTIQSNIGVAAVLAVGIYRLCRKSPASMLWKYVMLASGVSITLTGTVFCFVLAPTMGANAWNLTNVLTHVVVPVCTVADLFVSGDAKGLPGHRAAVFSLLPAIAYAVYATIGYFCGLEFGPGINYPYFFLNWGSPAGALGFSKQLPFMGVIWWILALTVILYAIARLYIRLTNIKKPDSTVAGRI